MNDCPFGFEHDCKTCRLNLKIESTHCGGRMRVDVKIRLIVLVFGFLVGGILSLLAYGWFWPAQVESSSSTTTFVTFLTTTTFINRDVFYAEKCRNNVAGMRDTPLCRQILNRVDETSSSTSSTTLLIPLPTSNTSSTSSTTTTIFIHVVREGVNYSVIHDGYWNHTRNRMRRYSYGALKAHINATNGTIMFSNI